MSDLTQRIAQLSTEERIRLEERLLAARKNGGSQRIPRRAESGPAPLSFTQERLWFLAQLEPDSAAYNETQVLRLTGPLHIPSLQRSLDALAARHDSLRVCFREIGDGLVQVAEPLPPTHIHVIDLAATPQDAQMDAAWQQIDTARAAIFDLTSPPLWRVFLIRLADDNHIFVRIVHHIISDGWSSSILWRELRHYYAAYAEGSEPTPLPELPVSYADFSVWQREQLQGERLAGLVGYWRERLAGVEPLNLPTDHPRPTQPSHKGTLTHFQLDQELSDSLSALARALGASLYMLLLTAFQILLHRYSGQDDIVVGSPIANRSRPELEGIYGFFVNTLVMRADCSGNPTFRSLLARVRENALGAYQHQDLPYAKLVEELRPDRELSRNPLYDVTFALQNVPRNDLNLSGLICQRLSRTETSSKFDLSLFLQEAETGLVGRLEYATDLYEPSTIQRMISHFQTLLIGIVANPDCPIGELPLLTNAERHQLLIEWNTTVADYPEGICVHQLFEIQVIRTPDAVAVVFEDEELTYRELNTCADQLARCLTNLGVGAEKPVGLLVEHSIEMVVGVLGILKAGGAYVPLSPDTPTARLRFIAEDTGFQVLVTQKEIAVQAELTQCRLVYLDADMGAFERDERDEMRTTTAPVLPTNLAYILYTSGSTGRPKGVAVEHRQVVQYGFGVQERCGFRDGMSYAMVQPLTVDSCVTMLFPSLWTGGSLHIIPREVALSSDSLADYFARHPIDCLKIAPSHLAALLPASVLPRLRLIIGGEASRGKWMQSLDQATGAVIYNHYGPTETTVGVLTYQVDSTTERYNTTPIGRPLPNTQVYILNRYLQPVPVGCPGELYIGGSLVARGYVNNPELTQASFIPNPFGSGRLYKTGDMVRYLPDGNIAFLGREDRQVKIRGFRIEPQEIEAALLEHPMVQEALITVDDTHPDKELVAYFVGSGSMGRHELRTFLSQKLPPAMIPSIFAQLPVMPITPHGKVDYRALPHPNIFAISRSESEFTPPVTPTESKLAAIWSEFLHVNPVGIHDNFFELGGHSLKAVQVVSRIRDTFDVALPLRALFEGPTIANVGQKIETLLWHAQPGFNMNSGEAEEGEL